MKKLICMVLVVAMALSMGITSAFADNNSATVEVESTTGYIGGTVSVTIDLSSNTGVYGMLLPITYDKSMLSLQSFSSGEFTRWSVGVIKDSDGNETGNANAVWDNSKEEDNTATGGIITLNFTVVGSATGTADVSVGGTKTEAYNYKLNEVTLQNAKGASIADADSAAAGTVTIAEAPVVPETLTCTIAKSLYLKGEVSIIYTLSDANFEVNDNVELLLFEQVDFDNIPVDSAGKRIYEKGNESYSVKFTLGADGYEAYSQGIPAKNMGDTLVARLCVKNGNSYVYGNAFTYNPVSYCKAKIGGSDTNLSDLCLNLMKYGVAAQTYFGWTDSHYPMYNVG